MSTKAGVGVSRHRNPSKAAEDAVAAALAPLDGEADFAFMFATVGYDQEALLGAVRKALGGAPVCGCSAEGTITREGADESNFSVSVMAIRSSELRFVNGVATGLKKDSGEVGKAIASDCRAAIRDDTRALFLFPDGMSVNFDGLMRGLHSGFAGDRTLPVFGGASWDNWSMKRTYQYCNDEVVSDGASWALMSGEADLQWGINHGCVPIGGELEVTRADGNAIYEIDGKPVLEVIFEYLEEDEVGNWEKAVTNLSIGLEAPGYIRQQDADYQHLITRFMPSSDDLQDGFVTIPTEVTSGTKIWITRRDYRKIKTGLERMADELHDKLGDSAPKFILHFDCAGRGKTFLRDQQKTELLDDLQQRVGPTVPWLGFYTAGEIGPMGGHNCFHNYTAVVLAVR